MFGFAQFDFAGTLPLADGRYLTAGEAGESVLVVLTLAAPAPPRRRRRRPREVEAEGLPATLPLVRATAVRAFDPLAGEGEAEDWLRRALADEESTDAVLAAGLALLNRALHAQAVASAAPAAVELALERAVAARLGYGSGEQVAAGEFAVARAVEVASRGSVSRRRRREEELRPQERVAALLRGRERIDACEPLLLRARADLDAGREREAALQLRVGLEALLAELEGSAGGPGHEEDMATLRERRGEAGAAANEALRGELGEEAAAQVLELLGLCERVLRRRRVLRG